MHPNAKPIPLPGSRYLTYPHCNGFRPGSNRLVICEALPEQTRLIEIDLSTGSERPLLSIHDHLEYLWFDIATERDALFYVAARGLVEIELDKNDARPRLVYEAPRNETIQVIPTVTADGRTAAIGYASGESYGLRTIDLATGESQCCATWNWYANHFHFSPYDPAWIGFCHEGSTDVVFDRIHAWNAELAPNGCCIFDQQLHRAGEFLCVGHERWCFHDLSAVAVAYGQSPTGPRGLWQVRPDGRPRLVSGSDRDWHCNISCDGRMAVVDTTGPHDEPGVGWENNRGISDILLVDMESGNRRFIARSTLGVGQHAHPHPTFTPDAKWIVYNECIERSEVGERSRMRFVSLEES